MTLDERLKAVFADAFETQPEAIDENLSVANADGWDSMRAIVLASSIEADFGIEFSDSELVMLDSYRKIRESLLAKGVPELEK